MTCSSLGTEWLDQYCTPQNSWRCSLELSEQEAGIYCLFLWAGQWVPFPVPNLSLSRQHQNIPRNLLHNLSQLAKMAANRDMTQLINQKFIIPIPKPHLQLLDFQSVKNIFSLWRKKPKHNIGILKPTLNKTWTFWLCSQISLLVYEILAQTLFKPKEKLYISKIWKKCWQSLKKN